MHSLRVSAAAVSLAFVLAGCTPPPPSTDLIDAQQAIAEQVETWSARSGIRRIKLPGRFFVSEPVRPGPPAQILAQTISLRTPATPLTFRDVVRILENRGITVAYAWDQADNIETTESLVLPFRRFDGTLAQLLTKLRMTLNVASWWQGGALYFSSQERFAITVPQEQSILDVIAQEITDLGGQDVIGSLYGGQINYTAPPALQTEVIEPFLKRLTRNLSEITMQLAVVQVTLNEQNQRGFDWAGFNLSIDAENNPSDFSSGALTSSSLGGRLIRDNIAIFGTQSAITVNSAINFLSTFGRTRTMQNVEIRTLAGQSVTIDSTESIPYVEEITSSTSGDSTTQGIEFAEVDVGITLNITPYFDSDTSLLTVAVDFTNGILQEFLEVSAGDDTVRRPVTRSQTLNDLVRVAAGETIVIGGLSTATSSDNRNAPWAFWEVGSSNSSDSRNALFIIIRPMVTLFEIEGIGFEDMRQASVTAPAGVAEPAPAAPLPRIPGLEPPGGAETDRSEDGIDRTDAMAAPATPAARIRELEDAYKTGALPLPRSGEPMTRGIPDVTQPLPPIEGREPPPDAGYFDDLLDRIIPPGDAGQAGP